MESPDKVLLTITFDSKKHLGQIPSLFRLAQDANVVVKTSEETRKAVVYQLSDGKGGHKDFDLEILRERGKALQDDGNDVVYNFLPSKPVGVLIETDRAAAPPPPA